MVRSLLIFAALASSLFAAELTPAGQQWIVDPWTSAVARMATFAITSFDDRVIATGRQILDQFTGQGISIEAGCNGLEAMIVLGSAMVAFPAQWSRRITGLVLGGIAIQALNLVRIATLFYLARHHATAFEWAHLYLWQSLIMIDVLVVWLVWLRWARRSADVA